MFPLLHSSLKHMTAEIGHVFFHALETDRIITEANKNKCFEELRLTSSITAFKSESDAHI